MTHEDFVTYEQAIKLKELGFNWLCDKYYATQNYCEGNNPYDFVTIGAGDLIYYPKYREDENDGWIPDEEWCVSAPTLAQAQKWLREVKETEVIVDRIDDVVYSYTIYGQLANFSAKTHFNFYEQALKIGIDRAIELLKENGK